MGYRTPVLLLLATLALAQVVPIDPFTGRLSEGLEGHDLTAAPPACVDLFDGEASLCAPEAAVGGIQVRDRLYVQCLLNPHEGERLAGSNDGATEVHFDVALQRFGAWIATHGRDGDLTVELYGHDGTLLHADTSAFGGACEWTWRGYETSGAAIWTVRLAHSDHGGGLVDVDDLQAEPRCGFDDRDCDGSPATADCDDLDPDRTPGAPEICDQLDNDCDGSLPDDEGDGDTDGHPACADCDDGDPTRHPDAPETCNGVDDDCSGTVDDHLVDVPEAAEQQGVCAGAEQVCVDGAWTEPDYDTVPHYEATEASCDGLDNDCDGAVDDIEDPPGVGTGLGICAEVPRRCEGEQGWVEPEGWQADIGYQEDEYLCDGLDNDCDGEIDEDLGDDPATCPELVCLDGAWTPPPAEDCPRGLFGGCQTQGAPGWLAPWLLPLLLLRRRT